MYELLKDYAWIWYGFFVAGFILGVDAIASFLQSRKRDRELRNLGVYQDTFSVVDNLIVRTPSSSASLSASPSASPSTVPPVTDYAEAFRRGEVEYAKLPFYRARIPIEVITASPALPEAAMQKQKGTVRYLRLRRRNK